MGLTRTRPDPTPSTSSPHNANTMARARARASGAAPLVRTPASLRSQRSSPASRSPTARAPGLYIAQAHVHGHAAPHRVNPPPHRIASRRVAPHRRRTPCAHDHPAPVDAPMGIPARIFSISARFMNCSSASTRAVCVPARRGAARCDARRRRRHDTTTRRDMSMRGTGRRAARQGLDVRINETGSHQQAGRDASHARATCA